MKIWILFLKRAVGGAGHCAYEIAETLDKKQGVSVTTYCMSGTEFYDWARTMGLFPKPLASGQKGFVRSLLEFTSIAKMVNQELHNNPPDVVVVPMTSPRHLIALRQIKKSGAKVVHFVHEVDYRKGNADLKAKAGRMVRRFELKASDLHVAFSKFTLSALQDRDLGIRAESVVHPVFSSNVTKIQHDVKHDRPRKILFFGRLTSGKGVSRLVDAFILLRNRLDKGLELELCLRSDRFPELESMEGVTVCRGFIDEEALLKKIAYSDVVALPYDHASQSGVAALSLGVGCPCVVTPVGGLPEQVIDGLNGFVADDMSTEAFADALERCFDSEIAYSRLLQNIKKDNDSRLSWSPLAERIVALKFDC